MNRRIFCLLLTCVVFFTAFIPFAKADEVIMYASDGRTIRVNPQEAEKVKKKPCLMKK